MLTEKFIDRILHFFFAYLCGLHVLLITLVGKTSCKEQSNE